MMMTLMMIFLSDIINYLFFHVNETLRTEILIEIIIPGKNLSVNLKK